MRLISHGERGEERTGVILSDGRTMDASLEFPAYDEDFFTDGGLKSLTAKTMMAESVIAL